MQEIKLTVTINEANMILDALGNLPFHKVFGLIEKIQQQATGQLRDNSSETKVTGANEVKK